MSVTRTPCEGKCCCQCSYCAGNGYYTQWTMTLGFSGTFIAAPTNPFDTSGGVGEPTVGTCTCSALSFSKILNMETGLDGVTGGLSEGPNPDTLEHVVHSCCRWGLLRVYDSTDGLDDCGTGRFVNLNPGFDCSNFVGQTGMGASLQLCGSKLTNGQPLSTDDTQYPFGASGAFAGQIKARKITASTFPPPQVDCDDDHLVPLLTVGDSSSGDAGAYFKATTGFNCSSGYTFSGAEITNGKVYFPFGGLGGKTYSGCYVSSVTFAPVAGSWRQCGLTADGKAVDTIGMESRGGAVSITSSKVELEIVRPDRCNFLGKREDFKSGCNGWKCGHGCTLGLPAVPGQYCQTTCQKYEVDPDYIGRGTAGWLA